MRMTVEVTPVAVPVVPLVGATATAREPEQTTLEENIENMVYATQPSNDERDTQNVDNLWKDRKHLRKSKKRQKKDTFIGTPTSQVSLS